MVRIAHCQCTCHVVSMRQSSKKRHKMQQQCAGFRGWLVSERCGAEALQGWPSDWCGSVYGSNCRNEELDFAFHVSSRRPVREHEEGQGGSVLLTARLMIGLRFDSPLYLHFARAHLAIASALHDAEMMSTIAVLNRRMAYERRVRGVLQRTSQVFSNSSCPLTSLHLKSSHLS